MDNSDNSTVLRITFTVDSSSTGIDDDKELVLTHYDTTVRIKSNRVEINGVELNNLPFMDKNFAVIKTSTSSFLISG